MPHGMMSIYCGPSGARPTLAASLLVVLVANAGAVHSLTSDVHGSASKPPQAAGAVRPNASNIATLQKLHAEAVAAAHAKKTEASTRSKEEYWKQHQEELKQKEEQNAQKHATPSVKPTTAAPAKAAISSTKAPVVAARIITVDNANKGRLKAQPSTTVKVDAKAGIPQASTTAAVTMPLSAAQARLLRKDISKAENLRRQLQPDAKEETPATAKEETGSEEEFTTTEPQWEKDIEGMGVDLHNYTANYTATWGDEKHNVMGLPSWAAVLVGGTAAALIMIFFTQVGARLSRPLPFFANEEQLLKDRIEQARDKVRALEQAVEAKRAAEVAAKLEEERKAREATEGPKPDGPSHDELVGEMLYRTSEVQKQAVGAVNDSIKQAAPLLARAAHVQHVFKQSVTEVQDRGAQMALKEATNLYSKMKEAVGADEGPTLAGVALESTLASQQEGLPEWFKFTDDDLSTDPPPFALLLSGMFAPAQLKSTRNSCNSEIFWNSLMIATCTACLTIDSRHGCTDKKVWAWILGMLIMNVLDVLCCSFIASRCGSAIGQLQDAEDATSRIRKTGNVIWDSYIMLQANSGHFFKAYFAYQSVVDSWIYTLQKFFTLIATGWGCFGMYVTMEDIIEDELTCDTKIVLWFMHTYSFFFLLFITWNVMGLAIWTLKKLSGLSIVSQPLLAMAKDSDDEVPFRMPIFQTLARAFLLRDNNTMLLLKAGQLNDEVAELEKQIEDTKQKMENRKGYLNELESKRVSAHAYETHLIEAYKKKVIEEGGELPGEVVTGVGSATSAVDAVGASSSTAFAGAQQAANQPAQEQGFGGVLDQAEGAASSSASSVNQPLLSDAGSSSASPVQPPNFTGAADATDEATQDSAGKGSGKGPRGPFGNESF